MIDVAHELRTPLTNIRGYLEALNDRVLPFSSETFTLLQNETLRLAELVEDVLQLARADAAHGQLDLQPVDLVGEVKTTLDYFARAFDEKSVTVNFHSAHDALIVQADKRRMARVLRNLTDNAARYAPTGSAVDIRLDADSRQVRIEYTNSAERLLAADLPHLFETLLPRGKIPLPAAWWRRYRPCHRQGTGGSPRRPGGRRAHRRPAPYPPDAAAKSGEPS